MHHSRSLDKGQQALKLMLLRATILLRHTVGTSLPLKQKFKWTFHVACSSASVSTPAASCSSRWRTTLFLALALHTSAMQCISCMSTFIRSEANGDPSKRVDASAGDFVIHCKERHSRPRIILLFKLSRALLHSFVTPACSICRDRSRLIQPGV